ncbi:hypothetical protein V6Z12_D07G205400 [Gossypium hirsutum]
MDSLIEIMVPKLHYFLVVKGVADNSLELKWIKGKSLGSGSYGVVHLVKLIDLGCYKGGLTYLLKEFKEWIIASLNSAASFSTTYHFCCFKRINPRIQNTIKVLVTIQLTKGHFKSHFSCIQDLIKKYGGNKPKDNLKCYIKMLLEGIHRIHAKEYSEIEPLILNFPGTPFYMPPKCGTTNKISVALDIWSLSCVVLQMVTVKPLEEFPIKMGICEGKDFLMTCFARKANERCSVEMLLSHPFLMDLKPTVYGKYHLLQKQIY